MLFTNLALANPEEGADKKPSVIFSPQIPLYVHFNEAYFEDSFADLANAELAYIRAKGKQINKAIEYDYSISKKSMLNNFSK